MIGVRKPWTAVLPAAVMFLGRLALTCERLARPSLAQDGAARSTRSAIYNRRPLLFWHLVAHVFTGALQTTFSVPRASSTSASSSSAPPPCGGRSSEPEHRRPSRPHLWKIPTSSPRMPTMFPSGWRSSGRQNAFLREFSTATGTPTGRLSWSVRPSSFRRAIHD